VFKLHFEKLVVLQGLIKLQSQLPSEVQVGVLINRVTPQEPLLLPCN
jgi:hypothetical protein